MRVRGELNLLFLQLAAMALTTAPCMAQAEPGTKRLIVGFRREECPPLPESTGKGKSQGEKLFADTSGNSPLAYCAYDGEKLSSKQLPRDAVTFVGKPVVVPQGTLSGTKHDYQRLREQLALPAWLPASGAPVKVAVLDSGSGTVESLDRTRAFHALAVSRVIEVVACGETTSGRCPVALENYHVLNLDALANGGVQAGNHFGTRIRLAEAIAEALSEAGTQHLVMNLSLGWSGCWEPSAAGLTPDSEAVRAAIKTAVCRGAIVVAAAGNRDAVPGCPADALRRSAESTHMLPGLWGKLQPTEAECSNVDGHEKGKRGAFLSIGAVHASGAPLGVTDHDSNLVAYGAWAAVPDPMKADTYTAALTGTSMSAAAVSGMLAALWRYWPDASTEELIKRLTTMAPAWSAGATPRPPFVCNSDECAPKRLSLCPALGGLSAELQRACATPIPGRSAPPAPAPVEASTAADVCESETACPYSDRDHDAHDAMEKPWEVSPQPGGEGCCASMTSITPPPNTKVPLEAYANIAKTARARDAIQPTRTDHTPSVATKTMPHGSDGAMSTRFYADETGARIRLEFTDAWRPRIDEVRMVAPLSSPSTAVLWRRERGSMPASLSVRLPEALRAPALCYLAYRADRDDWYAVECPAVVDASP